MKKIIGLLLLLLLIPIVNAGVGIVYDSEAIRVNEESKSCVDYGIYNPFDRNATAKISTGGELNNLTLLSEEVKVPANTYHDNAISTEICFQVPNVYKEDCFFWKIGCKQECDKPVKKYSGEILVSEVVTSKVKGSGSQVTSTVSAPLKVTVKCEPKERDWLSVIGLIGVVILAMAFILIWNQYYRE